MATRDYKDLLQVSFVSNNHWITSDISQCAIPVFNGLLPEPHNNMVMQLLFTCAHWHGLVKLWLHSDLTLDILDNVTITLRVGLRKFKNTVCPTYNTKELLWEAGVHQHWQIRVGTSLKVATAAVMKQIRKEYNLQTYKHHSLGDYTRTIRCFGTTDSYSTTVVSKFNLSPLTHIN